MAQAWICTRCGGGGCTVLEGKPSLDERYAVGWCDRCTPIPRLDPRRPFDQRKRGTVVLARDTSETRAAITRRDQLTTERKLVERVAAGDVPEGPRGDAMRDQAREIVRRWDAEAVARRAR